MKKIITSICFLVLIPTLLFAGSQNDLHAYRKGEHLQAMKGLQQLGKKNNKVALYYLGIMSFNGYGEVKNTSRALELISRSGKAGYMPASLFLADYYWAKQKDAKKALPWFALAGKQGDFKAQMFTAGAYLYGFGTKRNAEKARWYYIQAAKDGNANAQFALSIHFLKSRRAKNRRLGKSWLNKSAKGGSKAAMEQWIRVTTGRKIDFKPAADKTSKEQMLAWLTDPKGNVIDYTFTHGTYDWQNELARAEGVYNQSPKLDSVSQEQVFSQTPEIVNPDNIKLSAYLQTMGAINYRQKKSHLFIPRYPLPHADQFIFLSNEAIHGNAESQFKLGYMYQEGIGTEKDTTKAFRWYKKAAEQYNTKAEYNLGLLYLEGRGTSKHYKWALYWLEKASFKGNPYAQYLLGLTHEYGLGDLGTKNYIKKSITYASSMYHLSAGLGYPKAQFNLAELYVSGLLTQSKTVQAQRELFQLTLDLYEKAAHQGNANAKLALAYYYVESKDTKKQAWAFNVAEKAAKKGNPYATFILALMYDRGVGVDRDKTQAANYLEESSREGNPVANFILGTYYYLGEGVDKDRQTAISFLTKASVSGFSYADYNLAVAMYLENPNSHFLIYLRKAANADNNYAKVFLADYYLTHAQNARELRDAANIYLEQARLGYPDAQLKLAYMYDKGISFAKNPTAAQVWYKKSAQKKVILAQYLLGALYQSGKLGKPAPMKAIHWYKMAADKGFVPAQVAMGFMEESVNHNYKEALKWYLLAADQKNPQAEFNLALMYKYGKGVAQNDKLAFKWFQKSAKQLFAPSQYALATMYLKETAPKEWFSLKNAKAKAFNELKKAAAKKNSYALYELGVMSEKGLGTDVSKENAFNYFKESAALGNPRAQLALANIYDLGIGVEANKKKAFALYREVAITGNGFAQYKVSQMYAEGVGVTKNEKRAKKLYDQALVNGYVPPAIQVSETKSEAQLGEAKVEVEAKKGA